MMLSKKDDMRTILIDFSKTTKFLDENGRIVVQNKVKKF